jgi:hypothetical protein
LIPDVTVFSESASGDRNFQIHRANGFLPVKRAQSEHDLILL